MGALAGATWLTGVASAALVDEACRHAARHRFGRPASADDRLIRRDYQRIHSGETRGDALHGVNAVPLVRSEIGGKDGNVEADMLLVGLAVWNPRDRNIRSLWPRVG